jgi:mycothiol synthase
VPTPEAIERFLADLVGDSGIEAVSEAKRHRLRRAPEDIVVVAEGEDIVAVAIAAPHRQGDGSDIWELETAVRRDMQFPAFEGSVLRAGLDSVPAGAPVTVWTSRTTSAEALVELGFVARRTLAYMVVELPLRTDGADPEDVRRFTWADAEALIAINARAFANHREAAALDAEEFRSLTQEPWFSPEGIVVAPAAGPISGFCWTKVHDNGDGEIYRIAVDPDRHGLGLGRRLTVGGFAHLAGVPGVVRGALWVDLANTIAVELYERMGMVIDRTNTEYARS